MISWPIKPNVSDQAIDPELMRTLGLCPISCAADCLEMYVTSVVGRAVESMPTTSKVVSLEMVDRAICEVQRDVRRAKATKIKEKKIEHEGSES